LSRIEMRPPQAPGQAEVAVPRPPQEMHEGRQDVALAGDGAATGPAPGRPAAAPARPAAQPVTSRAAVAEMDPRDPGTWGKVARNAVCPCGSGKKYKHCHGKLS